LDRFPVLKDLSLQNLSALEYISDDAIDASSSLQSLSLWKLPKLRGWWRMREAVTTGSETTPSSSSPFSTLSKLKYLDLSFLEKLEYLPEEWLQNLTSLEILKIWECPKLQISISPLFQHLAALEDMRFVTAKNLSARKMKRARNALDLQYFVIYK